MDAIDSKQVDNARMKGLAPYDTTQIDSGVMLTCFIVPSTALTPLMDPTKDVKGETRP